MSESPGYTLSLTYGPDGNLFCECLVVGSAAPGAGGESPTPQDQSDYDAFGTLPDAAVAGAVRFSPEGLTAAPGLTFADTRSCLAQTGPWLAEDPVGCAPADGNLRGYVHRSKHLGRGQKHGKSWDVARRHRAPSEITDQLCP